MQPETVLAELLPRRRSALLTRGREFGDSRRVCNVHFRSDVEAGQSLAAPVLADTAAPIVAPRRTVTGATSWVSEPICTSRNLP